nr:MAG TPA: hypothetical protein [Caudoviricetes sp.]
MSDYPNSIPGIFIPPRTIYVPLSASVGNIQYPF